MHLCKQDKRAWGGRFSRRLLGGIMQEYEKREIIRYLIDNTPMLLDMEKQDLKYDARNINYKIYRYIRELQEEIKKLKEK